MQVELTGKISAVLQTQSGQSSKGAWEKNSFVVEWQENGYTQRLCLEVIGADKFEKMKNAVRVGNEVMVRFNVSSREYQGRYFTSATCFYCATVGNGNGNNNNKPQQQNTAQSQRQQKPSDNDSEELPF